MTEPKTILIKPSWFDTRKYQSKSKLTLLQWYGELSMRKSYRDILFSNSSGLDNYEPFHRLRTNGFATIGSDPIIPKSQLKLILNKDIWSKRNFKSHSARLSTCQDILDLEICEEIKEELRYRKEIEDQLLAHKDIDKEWEIPYKEDRLLRHTPVDLQDLEEGINLREAHLTINLLAPNSVLREDIWMIVETLKNEHGCSSEIVASERRDWAKSNVLEHIDLYLAEVQQEKEFKPSERVKWIPPNSDSNDQSKASTREKAEALKLLDDQILHQLYIEIYSADNKSNLDRE